jgi:ABC-type Fe3+/spermidine/putrescine transport system ATPase subunit
MRAEGPILELERVNKRFGPTVVARALDLVVARGEFFTFLGPSGSGKSTILRMIAGLESPDEGRIRLGGQDVSGVPPWRRNLGMMFQQYAIFPHMTVEENVAYGLRVRRMSRGEVDERVRRMLALVGLAGMEKKNATLLSGGEQQRVALARALAPEPRMLLLDEPLSALDEKIRRTMQAELKDVHRKTGTTFLYVTHDQEEALTMSDRVAVFNRGSCVQCGTPESVYRRPRTRFVAEFFRNATFFWPGSETVLSLRLLGQRCRWRFRSQQTPRRQSIWRYAPSWSGWVNRRTTPDYNCRRDWSTARFAVCCSTMCWNWSTASN